VEKQTFGEYEILSLLGNGSLGRTYKAQSADGARVVAIKVIPGEQVQKPDAVPRLEQDGAIATAVTHPNLVAAYEVGEERGEHYLVHEYVPGESLKDMLRRENVLPIDRAAAIVRDIARGLAALHEQGIVHRNVKPSNVVIAEDGRAKLCDFCCAIRERRVVVPATLEYFPGTAGYAAPEQIQSPDSVDERADIYALGVTFFHLITGHMPFEAETRQMALIRQATESTPDARKSNPDIPDSIASLIMKMAAREPADRYQSVEDVLKDLPV